MSPLRTVLCASALVLTSCGPLAGSPCDAERYSSELAGSAAVDCGRFTEELDPSPGTACALEAQRAGRPFVLRYEQAGREARITTHYVRTADGQSLLLLNDPAPCGNTSCGPEIRRQDCWAFDSHNGAGATSAVAYLGCAHSSSSRSVCRVSW